MNFSKETAIMQSLQAKYGKDFEMHFKKEPEPPIEVETVINVSEAKKEIDNFFAPFLSEETKTLPTCEQYIDWAVAFIEKVVEIKSK